MDVYQPCQKKKKYSNNITNNKFDDKVDQTQYCCIFNVLNEIFHNDNNNNNNNNNNSNNNNNNNDNIPNEILSEIAQYATGNYTKCQGEFGMQNCNGDIHFLHGDNFTNSANNNAWNLCKYECDDVNCGEVSHILQCSECNISIQINADETPYPNFICENALRLNPLCTNMFCSDHADKNGSSCEACSVYYCVSCEKDSGTHCFNCNEYWCEQHKDDSLDDTNYCDKCLFNCGLLCPNINDCFF